MTQRKWFKHRPLFASNVPKRKPKIQWKILPILGLVWKRTALFIGSIVLSFIILGLFFAPRGGDYKPPTLPKQMVLYLPLSGDFYETPAPESILDPFAPADPSAHEIVDALDRAANDPRVSGVLAIMESGPFTMALSEEVRGAIKRLRMAGKFAYIYSPSYGEGSGDLGRYYLASAFDEIWMQPMGMVSVAGIKAEVPFARDLLDKVGVYPQFYKRKEFKTAYESLTNSEMSPENRMELTKVIDDIRGELLKKISTDGRFTAPQFEVLVNKGLFTAPDALKNRLIDKADYGDVLVERIKKDVTGDPEASDDLFVDIQTYAHAALWEDAERNILNNIGKHKPSAALIYVTGAIMDTAGDGGNPIANNDGIAAADEIVPAIIDAAEDESIEAIILRVDSPGGSPVASESILRAVERAKKKGKPVIVSMGAAAASGGYWVSAYADQIFASPTTLTGSIGVLGGKFSLDTLWKKIGVNWDGGIAWGENAGMWSVNKPFSASESERFNAMLDNTYDAFTARVSKGRGLSAPEVEKIARGRVWTGAEAVKIGLVDQIGGLREAMNYTASILGAASKTEMNVVVLPRPETAFERLLSLLEQTGGVTMGARIFESRIFETIRPAMTEMMIEGEILRAPQGAAYEPLRVR
jgi:protease-4